MSYKIKLTSFLIIISTCLCSQTEEADVEYLFNKAEEYHYINKDSAYYYYEQTISMANAKDDFDYLFMGLSYLINANGHFYDLTNYQKNIERQEIILKNDERVKNFEWADYYRNYLLFEKGNYHYKIKEYSASKKYFLELYNKLESLPRSELFAEDIDMLSSINSFLGLINYHTGRYEQAENTYRRDIALVTRHADSLDDWQSSVISSKKLLSQVYEVQNRQEEANELLREALEFYSNRARGPSFKNSYLSTLMLLAKNFNKQGDYEQTIRLLNEKRELYSGDNPFSREVNFIKGKAYEGLFQITEALEEYKNGLDAYLEYRQNKPHQDVAMAYGRMAEFYIGQGNYDEAIRNLTLAFNTSGKNILISSLQENPKPQNVFSKRQLLHLLDLKLQLLQSAYLNNNVTYLNASINTNSDVLRTFDLLKKEFESKLDKQFLVETAYPIFHKMMEVTYTAYQLKPSSELLSLALNIAEKNKDFLLLEALRNARATEYGDVPKTILGKEAKLRAEITQLEKNLFDATGKESEFSEELSGRKEEYYSFLDTIKLKYPKYHDLKYQTQNLNLNTVRSDLIEDDGVLISYTMTEEFLYVIILNETKEKFFKLRFVESDRKEVREFHKLISRPSIVTSDEKATLLAKLLFDKILKRPLQGFNGQNLTIVPDDVLHYLPFDILQQNDKYLLHDWHIGYANSVSSLLEIKKRKVVSDSGFLAFAPSFEGLKLENNERKFGKLLYNINEVDAISSIFETEVFSETNATLQNFIKKAPYFKSIHLATHASANDEFPDFSYLAFSENANHVNTLYVKDLYNIILNADMVTLSACQTGIGKLLKGQGMLSLSKGFYYAGAKSLVNTLWKINDKSSVKLMEYFYQGLNKGMNKKEALRDAKLKYLATTDDNLLRHPYYWSAFVVSGDTAPIVKTSNWWYYAVGVLSCILLLAFIYFKRKTALTS